MRSSISVRRVGWCRMEHEARSRTGAGNNLSIAALLDARDRSGRCHKGKEDLSPHRS